MALNRLEKYWLLAVAVALGAYTAALVAGVVVFGIHLPSPVGRINPQNLETTAFSTPGVHHIGANRYEVYILARMWVFDAGPDGGAAGVPPTLHFPTGSEVTFYVTSKDVVHGFYIEEHSLNLEVVPGQVVRGTVNFGKPGTFNLVCHEYCGAGHQIMYGTIVVE